MSEFLLGSIYFLKFGTRNSKIHCVRIQISNLKLKFKFLQNRNVAIRIVTIVIF